MADELKIMARKAAKISSNGDTLQIQGAHIRPSTATCSIDAGNSQTFVVPEGADYLDIVADVAVWYRCSSAGSDAVVDNDEYLQAGVTTQLSEIYENGAVRKIRAGDILKCVVEA